MAQATTSPANDSYVRSQGSDAQGTHRFGVVFLPPARIVRCFGVGDRGDDYKVSKQWVFRRGPLVLTLYDWKCTDLYDPDFDCPENLWATEEDCELHIGSKAPATEKDVEEFVAFLRHAVSF